MARWKRTSAALSDAVDFRGGPVPDGPVAPDPPFSIDMMVFFQSRSRGSYIPLALAGPLWQFAAGHIRGGPGWSNDNFAHSARGPHSSGVEHSLGKGEVESSNLSVGTINLLEKII